MCAKYNKVRRSEILVNPAFLDDEDLPDLRSTVLVCFAMERSARFSKLMERTIG